MYGLSSRKAYAEKQQKETNNRELNLSASITIKKIFSHQNSQTIFTLRIFLKKEYVGIHVYCKIL